MAEDKKTIHIDEEKGKDEPGATGAEEAPYKTLQYAYIQTDGQGSYAVRKYEEGKPAEWGPASKAGTKKAATALAAHKKKQAKEAELVERTKKEQEAREKALEEAKKIVITEDASLPKARKIRLDEVDDTIHLHKEGSEEKGTRVRVLGTQITRQVCRVAS
jgi:asparaginyl-tRNA synthetase